MTYALASIVRLVIVYVLAYAVILFLIPKRWLPPDGADGEAIFSWAATRREWKALVAVGIVTLFVLRWPELLGAVVLIWLGELLWHRSHQTKHE